MPKNHLLLGLLAAALLPAAGACKKKAPPPAPTPAGARPGAPDPGSVVCPATETLTRMVQKDQPGRAVRTACVVFAPGYYWLGAALSYDDKTKGDVRLHMLSGGQSQRITDIDPVPAAALSDLMKKNEEVEVRIRKSGSENRLVRMGVMGRRGGSKQPEGDEIGLVLQLVAHASPKLLWIGDGDRIRTADGCTVEQLVNFEMPFGNRLEMVTSARGSRPGCASGPASQEQIESKGVALKPGRPLAGL
jgi:hypothetical protein